LAEDRRIGRGTYGRYGGECALDSLHGAAVARGKERVGSVGSGDGVTTRSQRRCVEGDLTAGVERRLRKHGVALHVKDVPWAEKQMWAPDANEKDGKYYLFFPAKDYDDIFKKIQISEKPIARF
jgi:hypothetical protein